MFDVGEVIAMFVGLVLAYLVGIGLILSLAWYLS